MARVLSAGGRSRRLADNEVMTLKSRTKFDENGKPANGPPIKHCSACSTPEQDVYHLTVSAVFK